MNSDRLLPCRPQGGLNDILCQIESCCRYAERFGRTVYVDTNHPGTRSFRDDFSHYFVSRQERLVLNPVGIRDVFDTPDVFPGFIAGRVSGYDARYNKDVKKVIERETGRQITFDFQKDYPQRLLVHHGTSFETGALSLAALSRMRVQKAIVDVLRERLTRIGREYAGVHIRQTDHTTAYEAWIAQSAPRIQGPIFLATDNRDVVAHCKSALGAERVYSFADLPPEAGKPAHHNEAVENVYVRNRDAILDLLMLALCKDLYLFEVKPNPLGAKYSGYSLLAASLKKARPVVQKLLAEDME